MGCCMSPKKRPAVRSTLKSRLSLSHETIQCVENLKINKISFVFHKRTDVQKDYNLSPKLGMCALGAVRLGIHKITKQERIVKSVKKTSITKDENSQAKFFEEIEILRRADHPNIVKLYGLYEDNQSYHLITEHLKGGDLFDFMVKYRALSELVAAHFFKELLWAVEYCHSNGLILRDLKPENLLLDKDSRFATLKVADFGTSSLFDPEHCFVEGSPYFIAPEVLKNSYNEKCDIWSCGVVLYVLLTGKPPFSGTTDEEILSKVESGSIRMKGPEWKSISEPAIDLLKSMLRKNPKKRPSAAECLHSPWMLDLCSNVVDPGTSQALENLKEFKTTEKFQEAVIGFITQQLVSKEEKKELIEQFEALDENGDGRLSKEELITAFEESMSREEAEVEVEKIMKEVDVDSDGFIEYSEFVMATIRRETLLSKENLEIAFRAFDADGSGSITANELRELIGSEVLTSEAVWSNLIEEADYNGDGVIDIIEFKEMMMKVF